MASIGSMESARQPGLTRAFTPAATWWLAAGAGSVVWATANLGQWLALAAAGAGLVGLAAALRAVVMLSRERSEADNWLRSGTESVIPQRYEWRATQLRADCARLRLAKTLRQIARRSADRSFGGFGASPPAAVAEQRDSLRLLASRLERIDQPVTPAGVLRVVDLITDGTGPLWNSRRGEPLGEVISSTLTELTPNRSD